MHIFGRFTDTRPSVDLRMLYVQNMAKTKVASFKIPYGEHNRRLFLYAINLDEKNPTIIRFLGVLQCVIFFLEAKLIKYRPKIIKARHSFD